MAGSAGRPVQSVALGWPGRPPAGAAVQCQTLPGGAHRPAGGSGVKHWSSSPPL